MKRLLALLIACLALTLAACGSDDDDSGDGGERRPIQTVTSETKKPAGGGEMMDMTTVDMKDIKYVPQDITVKAGTTVMWTNSDQVPHTVTKDAGPGPDFDSGTIDAGGEFEHTFDEPGKIDYVCTVHPNQVGSVTVEG